MGLTHGLQDQRFEHHLTVHRVTEIAARRSQMLQQDPHHVAVGSKRPQLAVGRDGFGRFVQHLLGLGQQRAQLHRPDRAQQFVEKRLQILATGSQLRYRDDDARGVVPQHGPHESIQIAPLGQPEKREDLRPRDGAALPPEEEGDHLVQQGLGVPHPSFGRPGDGVDRLGLHRHLFGLGDERKPLRDELGGNGLQIETLTAGNDGGQDLVDFGGGENELHVFGGLLHRLEQNVPRHLGKHVDFVDDVDLVAAPHGTGQHVLGQLTHGLRAVPAGGVDLDHVEGTLFGHGPAVLAFAAGLALFGVQAVQRLGEDPGERGLADAPGAHEKIGVARPVLDDGVLEGTHHVLLAHHVGKPLGPPLSGDDLIDAHLEPASTQACWSLKISRSPDSARSSSSFIFDREKLPCSAVPWISMNSPDSAMTTFMSTSARESSS